MTIDDWAIGHAVEHPIDAEVWKMAGEMLATGEVRRRRSDDSLIVISPRDTGVWVLILHPDGPEGRFRVGTLMPASRRYLRRPQVQGDVVRTGNVSLTEEEK